MHLNSISLVKRKLILLKKLKDKETVLKLLIFSFNPVLGIDLKWFSIKLLYKYGYKPVKWEILTKSLIPLILKFKEVPLVLVLKILPMFIMMVCQSVSMTHPWELLTLGLTKKEFGIYVYKRLPKHIDVNFVLKYLEYILKE